MTAGSSAPFSDPRNAVYELVLCGSKSAPLFTHQTPERTTDRRSVFGALKQSGYHFISTT
jgi:hypothetical protein